MTGLVRKRAQRSRLRPGGGLGSASMVKRMHLPPAPRRCHRPSGQQSLDRWRLRISHHRAAAAPPRRRRSCLHSRRRQPRSSPFEPCKSCSSGRAGGTAFLLEEREGGAGGVSCRCRRQPVRKERAGDASVRLDVAGRGSWPRPRQAAAAGGGCLSQSRPSEVVPAPAACQNDGRVDRAATGQRARSATSRASAPRRRR